MRLTGLVPALALVPAFALLPAACSPSADDDPEALFYDESLGDRLARIQVTATPARRTRPIASDFLGLSIEYSAARLYMEADPHDHGDPVAGNHHLSTAHTFTRTSAHFEQLLRNLGDGTLRIGGDSEESAYRFPDPIGADEIRATSLVTAHTGWKAYLGVPSRSYVEGDHAYAQAVVDAATAEFAGHPQHLIGLELGNEPDMSTDTSKGYAANGADFIRQWKEEAAGLVVADPFRRFVGPAYAGMNWNQRSATDRFATLGSFREETGAPFLTIHDYSFPAGEFGYRQEGGRDRGQMKKIALLLGEGPAATDRRIFSAAAAAAAGTPLVVGEASSAIANSYSSIGHGGCGIANGTGAGQNDACKRSYIAGVSDSAASLLWALDYIFNGLEAGVDRFNFHTLPRTHYGPATGDGAYNAISMPAADGTMHARPLYYAMLVASYARRGELLRIKERAPRAAGVNLQWHAVREADGRHVLVYLVNKGRAIGESVLDDPSRSVGESDLRVAGHVEIEAAGFSAAAAFQVGGDTLSAVGNDAVRLAGHRVDAATDTLPAPVYHPIAATGGAFRVPVAHARATVVRLTLR